MRSKAMTGVAETTVTADMMGTATHRWLSPPAKTLRQLGRSYLAGRALHLVAVMLIVSLATFLMLDLLPGNLAYSLLGESAGPEDVAKLERELGLDRPVPERFVKWLGNAVRGDLGRSQATGERIAEAIAQRLPVSLQLMVSAQLMALVIAVPLGLVAGYRTGGRADRFITTGAFAVMAVPHFVLGIVLILLVAVWWHLLPASGYVPLEDGIWGCIQSMFLPALTLALVEAPVYLRLLRGDIASTMEEDFITVARAKGLSDRAILVRHALRPSSFSLLTVMGINIGHLIGGAVIIETLFALPGVGRLLVEAINKRDLLMMQGVVLFIAAAFVVVNLLVDAAYAVLDPRIRRGR